MNRLKAGEFYGTHYKKSASQNVIITDTEYTHEKVDWHYHENPYFTYLLQGKLFESSKKESYSLTPGSLLFHNWQDAHYNIKPPEYTRGFHIELKESWLSNYCVQLSNLEGSLGLENPITKNLMNKIFIESKIDDKYSYLSIEALLLEIFSSLKENKEIILKRPAWTNKLSELLMEEEMDYSLKQLSSTLEIHPVHLSREFSRYFGMTLGNYTRIIKINKAFRLIASKQYSMTEICYKCGFYDQSHFILCFKRIYKVTPSQFLKNFDQC